MDTFVPAQFDVPGSYDLGPELVDATRQQVLQIVSRPLSFPVTWRDMTGQDDEETPRLTALFRRDGEAEKLPLRSQAPGFRDPDYVAVTSGHRRFLVLV